MKNALVLALALTAFLATSAFCQYTYNWSDGFENYGDPGIPELHRWYSPTGNPLVATSYPVHTGSTAVRQIANKSSCSAADLGFLNSNNSAYRRGYAKFWLYDPGEIAGVATAALAGVYSSSGPDSIGHMFAAGVITNSSRDFWNVRWSYNSVNVDGVTGASGTGYTITPHLQARRAYNTWNSVMIKWDIGPTTGTVQWFINQESRPNLTASFNNTSLRWPLCHDVAGLYLGSVVTQANPATFDDVEFHADAVPEPSSLLALAGGMVGLVGMIRRKR